MESKVLPLLGVCGEFLHLSHNLNIIIMARGKQTTIKFTINEKTFKITYDSYVQAMKTLKEYQKAKPDFKYEVVS